MKNLYGSLLAFVFLCMSVEGVASHVAGAKITYVEISPGSYIVNLAIIRDCGGINLTASAPLDVNGPCGSFVQTLPQVSSFFSSNTCDPILLPSNCIGGPQPGFEIVQYSDTVVLQQGFTCDWTLSWDVCCRNGATVNLANPASDATYVEAFISGQFQGQNSSPDFLDVTIPVVCANTQVTRNPVVIDLDGDSLVYELVSALDAGAVPLMYTPPFTGPLPITGITVDPLNGAVTFTPTTVGSFVVVTQVSEYRNGQFIGRVMFDRQFFVTTCTNTSPIATTSGLTNFTGTADQTGPSTIAMCEGQDFCFDLTFDDLDPGQMLSITSNIASSLPGASLTTAGTGPVVATICWTAPTGSVGVRPVIVDAVDGVCPLQGSTSQGVVVFVTPGTFAGPDVTVCDSLGEAIGAFGFDPVQWTVLSGDPIVIGTNFSCDTCVNAIASPAVATTYLLTSLGAPPGCLATDTITVNAIPDPITLTTTPLDTMACVNTPVQLNILATPADSTFTYSWSPSNDLDDPNIPNPILTTNSQGSNTLTVVVSNSSGCNLMDSAVVNISASPWFDLGLDSIDLNAPLLNLNGTGEPSGGVYLGNGVFDSIFNPAAAGVGTWVLVYQGGGNCVGSAFDTIVVFSSVGISELEANGSLLLMPNPTSDFFFLESDLVNFETLELMNMQGQIVRTWSSAEQRYSMVGLAAGSYIVRYRARKTILTGHLQKQ